MTFESMGQAMRSRMMRGVLLTAYLLACALVGTVRDPHPTKPPIDLRAYALPDGTVPQICSATNAAGHVGVHNDICGQCCFTDLPGLQPPAVIDLLPTRGVGNRLMSADASFRQPAQRFAPLGARAPPLTA